MNVYFYESELFYIYEKYSWAASFLCSSGFDSGVNIDATPDPT
jgi:hypothetical protein